MPRLNWTTAILLSLSLIVACKKKTPTEPTQNEAPVINSVTLSSTFGITALSNPVITVVATDPDGDTLTYSWVVKSLTKQFGPFNGSQIAPTLDGPFSGKATVTVDDGHGHSVAADSNTFVVGAMNGLWECQSLQDFPNTSLFYLKMTQDAQGNLTAIITNSTGVPVNGGVEEGTHPSINGAGLIGNLQLKYSNGPEIQMTGQLQANGQTVIGTFGDGNVVIDGKSLTGKPFTLTWDGPS
jgi:hypothetical protein